MEVFAMGPKRDRDGGRLDDPLVSLAPLELDSEPEDADLEHPAERDESWLAELFRADVLAVTSAAGVVVTVLGLPFTQFLENLYFIPVHVSSTWIFLPVLLAAGIATAFGLGAVRQAVRQGAATWVRAVAGTATLLGVLLFLGTAVVWLYAVESGLLEEIGRVF